MSERERFKSQIDAINAENFEFSALNLFNYQYRHNSIYKKYVDALGVNPNNVNALVNIPYLPISFFKSQTVTTTHETTPTIIFESSGTTGSINSKHLVYDVDFYLANSKRIFESNYGPLSQYVILALLPSYLERNNSSLVCMIDHFIKETRNELSGFYLYDYDQLIHSVEAIKNSQKSHKKVIIWGVSFALLDIAEQFNVDFSDCIIMETGGMKGRRAEMTREELHNQLAKSFKVSKIHSEYGMTELLSQSYSQGNGLFSASNSMRILTREVNDPLTISEHHNKTGGINVVDLANVDSCAFIETQDLGKVLPNGNFEVLGRFDNSDLRGCNLLIG